MLIDHHFAHSLAPCFNLPNNKKTLIFTLDGEGSGTCATVSVFDGKNLRVLSRSRKNASLGYLYAITTIYLGMKPLEHEFKVMGLSDKKIDEDFGHLLKAYKYGAPPHGGIALGLDRLCAIFAGEINIREVMAFPISGGGQTSVMDAPAEIDNATLKELKLKKL